MVLHGSESKSMKPQQGMSGSGQEMDGTDSDFFLPSEVKGAVISRE